MGLIVCDLEPTPLGSLGNEQEVLIVTAVGIFLSVGKTSSEPLSENICPQKQYPGCVCSLVGPSGLHFVRYSSFVCVIVESGMPMNTGGQSTQQLIVALVFSFYG